MASPARHAVQRAMTHPRGEKIPSCVTRQYKRRPGSARFLTAARARSAHLLLLAALGTRAYFFFIDGRVIEFDVFIYLFFLHRVPRFQRVFALSWTVWAGQVVSVSCPPDRSPPSLGSPHDLAVEIRGVASAAWGMVALVSPPLPVDVGVSAGLLCSACGFLLIRPKQTECGHRYCDPCVQGLFRTGEEAQCSVCQEKLSQKKFHNDRAAENDTLAIQVKCPNISCTWQGPLKAYLNSHQQECTCVTEPCPNATLGCDFLGAQKGMKMHLGEECPWRMVPCPCCSALVSLSLLKDHSCSPIEKRDASIYGTFNPSRTELSAESCSKMVEHSRTFLHCPMEKAESQEKSHKENLNSHTRDVNEPHLVTLLSQIHLMQAQIDKHNAVNTNFKQLVMDKLVSLTGSISRTASRETLAESRRENDRKVESLEKTISALHQDLQRHLAVLEGLQYRCLEYEKVILQSRSGQSGPASSPQEPVSTNGILVWKIENVASLLRTAKAEQRTSFYSPAFCTHPFGYRLCCRLYPNGDGSGKGTHVSLFLVVMRGDYDDVLRWPFRQKVTFLVLDQAQQQKPFRESFIPDALSASFHKPNTHMNVASGSPQFLRHSQLLASMSPYLRNDTFYIKVVIDPSGLDV